ncbi:unnamed protein product [Ascophyllum nodosum]
MSTRRSRGPIGACGKVEHGKRVEGIIVAVCYASDCAFAMYRLFVHRRRKLAEGSGSCLEIGQPSPLGRFPTLAGQVYGLLEHVHKKGSVLDGCGSRSDAVSHILSERGYLVTTNDVNRMLSSDTHMDASSVEFVEHFLEEGRRPDWFVTSPLPVRNAFAFPKNACRIAKVGVAFKLRLIFLEPVNSRALWLTQNPLRQRSF